MKFALSQVTLILSLVGCAGTTSQQRSVTDDGQIQKYAPLTIGATWTYQRRVFDEVDQATVQILAEKEGYFVDSAQGAWRHTPSGLRDRERYLIKAPLRVGHQWKTVVSASAVEHAEIVGLGSACEAQAGVFPDCLVVESWVRRDKNMRLLIRWFWAKGVGLVKIETAAEIAGRGLIPQTEQSLVSYQLASVR